MLLNIFLKTLSVDHNQIPLAFAITESLYIFIKNLSSQSVSRPYYEGNDYGHQEYLKVAQVVKGGFPEMPKPREEFCQSFNHDLWPRLGSLQTLLYTALLHLQIPSRHHL